MNRTKLSAGKALGIGLASSFFLAMGGQSAQARAVTCDVTSDAWPCFSDSRERVSRVGVVPQPRARRNLRRSPAVRRSRASRAYRRGGRRVGRVFVVRRGAYVGCIPPRLRRLARQIARHYGRPLYVTSGYRSHRHNRRVGGARRSQHLHCNAIDFRVPGVSKYALARYVKRLAGRGGVGTYCRNNIVHLDVGPRRTWHWGCRKHRRRYYAKRMKRKYYRKAGLRKRYALRRKAIRLRGRRG